MRRKVPKILFRPSCPREWRKPFALASELATMVAIGVVYLYQYTLSIFLGPCCRFSPSCSAYALHALKRFGIAHGGWLVLKRLTKCHPFHPGGYDPVPAYRKGCERGTIS